MDIDFSRPVGHCWIDREVEYSRMGYLILLREHLIDCLCVLVVFDVAFLMVLCRLSQAALLQFAAPNSGWSSLCHWDPAIDRACGLKSAD
jgi:hypothetical protein